MRYTPTTYDLTEAALENAVREASANIYRHRLNYVREREYQQQLREADAALQQHRRQRDPAAYEAHQQWRDDCAAHDYALSQDPYYYPAT